MRYRITIGDLGVEDLVQETFVRVFKKAHTYKALEAGQEHGRARVRTWLGIVANRLFLSSLRGQPLIDFADAPYDSVEADPPATESVNAESEYMPVLRDGLRTLSAREREVLVASYAWYESGTGFKRMPSEELATLCARFQTTAVNVRQIRSRALEKLKKYMEDHRNA
jgi:RNA polymerase sigma factor (sigma-70 family)